MGKEAAIEEEEDEVYFKIEIKRSDVEARFAETGQAPLPRSMEIIGNCLRDTDVEVLKTVILTELLKSIKTATEEKLAQTEAERIQACQVE